MKNRSYSRRLPIIATLAFLTSCATIPDYKPIVDTSSVDDVPKLNKDIAECEDITNQVDYSDEEAIAALAGAGVGAAAVVGGTAVVLGTTGGFSALAAGATLSPVVWPLLGAGMLIGSQTNKRKTNVQEQKLRAVVWNRCLMDRGYAVLTEDYDPT